MGNGDGPAVHPKWQVPLLCRVHVPFLLNGERATITRLHATWHWNADTPRKPHIEVRVDYPDRPHGEEWREGCLPAGDVFYIESCRYYPKDELLKTIRMQQAARVAAARKREEAKVEREKGLMNKRIEIDSIVNRIAHDLGESE